MSSTSLIETTFCHRVAQSTTSQSSGCKCGSGRGLGRGGSGWGGGSGGIGPRHTDIVLAQISKLWSSIATIVVSATSSGKVC
jgi:hypothetical protein